MRKRYIQDPVTLKLIPVEDYRGPGVTIQDDIEPFVSPVDGTVITSRSALREHNRRNNVVNYHEMESEIIARQRERIDSERDRPRRLQALRFAMEVLTTTRPKAEVKQMIENYRILES